MHCLKQTVNQETEQCAVEYVRKLKLEDIPRDIHRP